MQMGSRESRPIGSPSPIIDLCSVQLHVQDPGRPNEVERSLSEEVLRKVDYYQIYLFLIGLILPLLQLSMCEFSDLLLNMSMYVWVDWDNLSSSYWCLLHAQSYSKRSSLRAWTVQCRLLRHQKCELTKYSDLEININFWSGAFGNTAEWDDSKTWAVPWDNSKTWAVAVHSWTHPIF